MSHRLPTILLKQFGLLLLLVLCSSLQAQERVKGILLGDNGHHQPSSFYRVIQKPLADLGIDIEYSDDVVGTLNNDRLQNVDVVLIYANIDAIEPAQEKALIEFVENGKGLVPIHCATYCFRNSDAYVNLVGGQFLSHGGERFSTVISNPSHEIMKGFSGFESWDETYIHHKQNTKDRIVLEERREGKLAEGTNAEPWTWIRTQGKGRVFYTAWGHNIDTWQQPGFHNLLERGIKWSAKRSLDNIAPYTDSVRFPTPAMTSVRKDLKTFTYTEVGDKIPNYTPGQKWGTLGKPITTMQDPLRPEQSSQHFVTPQDFKMELWASESEPSSKNKSYAGLAGKPLAMTWDHRGRLWLCETIDYPNELQAPGQGRDQIRICEDTNHDGVADQFTVFATHLSIPTTLVCYRDGVIVQDGQKTVYLKDTNGDDVADMRQELITGWALGDTHGGVSNFQYGLDNWIWAMQGYNDSEPVINGQKQQKFRQGFWRFAVEASQSNDTAPVYALVNGLPESTRSTEFEKHSIKVSKLEFIRSTNNNTWGLGISEEGLIFGSTANGNPSGFMPIPNRYYEAVSGWSPEVLKSIADNYLFDPITPNVRQVDQHGGYTAGCGHALYTARRYPKAWWNRIAFVCEPTGHLVGSFVLDRLGAGYRSTSPFNLVASDDEWAAPTMAEVGPDGNVWVIDWYNFIVQHNPTPQGFTTGKGNAYESDLRDKKYGRIYRVVYQGSEGLDKATLDKADASIQNGLNPKDEAALVAALSHPTMLWRKTAQRLLVERNKLSNESIDALQKLVGMKSAKGEFAPAANHALWVLNGVNALTESTSDLAMRSSNPAIRRNALQVAANSAASMKSMLDTKVLEDTDLQVRLAALLAVADSPIFDERLGALLSRPDKLTTIALGTEWKSDPWLLDAWTAAASKHATTLLPMMLSSKDWVPDAETNKRIRIVAEHAARKKMDAKSLEQMLQSPDNEAIASAMTEGFVAGWPKSHTLTISSQGKANIVNGWLGSSLPIESKSQILQLASLVGIDGLGEGIQKVQSELSTVMMDASRPDANRIAAAVQSVVLQPDNQGTVEEVLKQISTQSSAELSTGLLQSLSGARLKGLGQLVLEQSRSFTPETRKSAIRVLMSRPQTTLELLESIEAGKLSFNDLQLDQKQALRDHPNAEVRDKAIELMKMSGGVPNSDRQKVVEAWMSITHESGDVGNGKAMYQKHCSLCHIHGQIGVNIGPNLTGMAVHPKEELLVNILDPSRSVEGNFKTYSIRTEDGSVLTGMLASESKTSLELINAQGKREVILREDIEQLIASQKSLMPEGFEGQMTKTEMTDLLEFLTSKGKYVPLPIDSVATSVTTKGMFWEEKNTMERLVFPDWSPKTFRDVPFLMIDPARDKPNAIMLNGPMGNFPPKMPKQVEITCRSSAVAIHMLGGIGGWSYPASESGSISMIVRLHYADGKTEDHNLINGQHFADYIRRVDVPKSEFAFDLADRQVRYLSIKPERKDPLTKIELIKGDDISAPVVMAMTIQTVE
jgi:uncharacterized protein